MLLASWFIGNVVEGEDIGFELEVVQNEDLCLQQDRKCIELRRPVDNSTLVDNKLFDYICFSNCPCT